MSVTVHKRNGEIESIHIHFEDAVPFAQLLKKMISMVSYVYKEELESNEKGYDVIKLIIKEL